MQTNETLVVDRIEGSFAVCECQDGKMKDIPLSDIPFNPREGDVLILDISGIRLDIDETQRRREEITSETNDLWKV